MSVVGNVSHGDMSFCGDGFDHWTSLNFTEPRIYVSCFRAHLCSSVGYYIPTDLHWFTLNQGYISCICVNPCLSVGGYISPCPAGRNLINLWPRLAYAFSRFSEINCLTLSLAMLACYLNTRSFRAYPCPSVVGNVSHGDMSFCGDGLTTELHRTSLNQGYMYRVSVLVRARLWEIIFPLITLIYTEPRVPISLARCAVSGR